MKKKGLIISTVVMVVVLIASLTTATYAWFTASNKTSLSGFGISVVASNAVNIGLKKDMTQKPGTGDGAITDADFVSGDCTFTQGADGVMSAGSWAGTAGLGAQINHDIVWGEQAKAVGAYNATSQESSTDANKYGFIGSGTFNKTAATGKANGTTDGQFTFLNAANLEKGTTLTSVTAAKANYTLNGENKEGGDFVYMYLGVSPTKTLKYNKLVMLLDGSGSSSTTVGILAAVHVAYRVTSSTAASATTTWTEKEFFADYTQATKLDTVTVTNTDWAAAYKTAYNADAPTKKASAIVIDGLSAEQGAIDQVELIVYLAGPDADCIDSGKGASGQIKMFFANEDAEGSDKLTSATYTLTKSTSAQDFDQAKVTLAGITSGATVEYSVDNGTTWSTANITDNAFTMTTLPEDWTKVKVRQTVKGKLPSEAITVTQTASAKLTAATYKVDATSGTTFTLTGYTSGATVQYKVGDGDWKNAGTVSSNSVTVADLKTIESTATVAVRQIEAGKAASNGIEATATT